LYPLNPAYLLEPGSNFDPMKPDIDSLFKRFKPHCVRYTYGCGEYCYFGATSGIDKYGVGIPNGYGVK